jgi:uncharacterized membrane protein YdjX (TVP38/TMEM64 family)
MTKTRRRFLILAIVVVLLFAGSYLRSQLGIELSAESVRSWVADLGWYGPIIFIVLLALRAFVVLPSAVILSGGGLIFGVWFGTLLGSLGVVLSGMLNFTIARGFVRGRVRDARGESDAARGAGALGVAVVTGHPLGPMTAAQVGAGLSTMSVPTYLFALVLSAPIRAFGFSYFGTSIAEVGSRQFYLATGLLIAMIVIPLMHGDTRRRIFSLRSEEKNERAD